MAALQWQVEDKHLTVELNSFKYILGQGDDARDWRVLSINELAPTLAALRLVEPESIRRKHYNWDIFSKQLQRLLQPYFRQKRPTSEVLPNELLCLDVDVERRIHDDQRRLVRDRLGLNFQVILDDCSGKPLVFNVNANVISQ